MCGQRPHPALFHESRTLGASARTRRRGRSACCRFDGRLVRRRRQKRGPRSGRIDRNLPTMLKDAPCRRRRAGRDNGAETPGAPIPRSKEHPPMPNPLSACRLREVCCRARDCARRRVLRCSAGACARRSRSPCGSLGSLRGPGADACSSGSQIAAWVEKRFAKSPFAPDAALSIDAYVTHAESGWRAQIYIRNREGGLAGSRELTSDASDCASIQSAAVLVIALTIDPEAGLLRLTPPPSSPTLPRTPPPVTPSPSPPRSPMVSPRQTPSRGSSHRRPTSGRAAVWDGGSSLERLPASCCRPISPSPAG